MYIQILIRIRYWKQNVEVKFEQEIGNKFPHLNKIKNLEAML